MKKILISSSMVFAVAAIAIGGTFAYFSDSGTSSANIFSTGTLDLKLNGNDDVSATWSMPNMAPGDVASASINLTNTGSIAANHLEINSVVNAVTDVGINATQDLDTMLEITALTYDGTNILPSILDANTNGTIDLDDLEALTNAGSGVFTQAGNYATGQASQTAAKGDLDGDGDIDIVTQARNNIYVLMNNGNGTFASPISYSIAIPGSIAIADLNGDGKVDIAVVDVGSSHTVVDVLMNNGDGTFATPVGYSIGTGQAGGLAIADLNGDGKADIAFANSNPGNVVSVLMNNGDGTFAAPANYTVDTSPNGVALADLNGDGKADIAVANSGASDISVLMNNGDGTFAAAVNYAVGSNPRGIAVADTNNDGHLDIAVANTGSSNISVLVNSGTGTFAPAVNYSVGATQPYTIALADLNGDSKADIAVANNGTSGSGSYYISVFMNDGSGAFTTPVNYADGSRPYALVIADVNGDGGQDIVADNYLGTVTVFLNTGTGGGLDNLAAPLPGGSDTKVLSMTILFNPIAGNEYQGDSDAMSMKFQLNQNESQ